MEFNCGDRVQTCKAECCGPVPFPKKLYKRLRSKALRKVEKVKELYQKMGPSLEVMVVPFTFDLTCPFLGKDYQCVVYEDRPEICRIFGKESLDPKLRCPCFKENGEAR